MEHAVNIIDAGVSIYTSGEWTIFECPGGYVRMTATLSKTLSHYTSGVAGTSLSGYYTEVTFPITMKKTTYSIQHTWGIGNGFGITAGVLNRKTTGCTIYALATASGSQNCVISISVEGEKG